MPEVSQVYSSSHWFDRGLFQEPRKATSQVSAPHRAPQAGRVGFLLGSFFCWVSKAWESTWEDTTELACWWFDDELKLLVHNAKLLRHQNIPHVWWSYVFDGLISLASASKDPRRLRDVDRKGTKVKIGLLDIAKCFGFVTVCWLVAYFLIRTSKSIWERRKAPWSMNGAGQRHKGRASKEISDERFHCREAQPENFVT